MRRIFVLFGLNLSLLFAGNLSSEIKPLVNFSPPPFINPQSVLLARVENQFDNAPRQNYHSVSNALNNAFTPFHFSSGIYGNSTYNALLFRFRASKIYGVLNAHYTKANDYKDGDGDKMGFGYKRVGANAMLGFVPNAYNELKAAFFFDNIADDKQPHYMMDPVRTTRYLGRLEYRLGEADLSNALNLSAIYRDISREANNFKLRENSGARIKMKVKRKILDLSARYDFSWSILHNEISATYTRDTHVARRFAKPVSALNFTQNGFRFANVKVDQISLFDELKFTLNELNSLNLSVQYDYNAADIRDKNFIVARQGATQITANNMYFAHFGKRVDGKIKQDALSAALKYEFKPSENQLYTLNAQSIERIPSNDERFVSLNPPGTNAQQHAQAWVSDPFLKPERRNRVKMAFSLKSDAYKAYMSSLYDENALKFEAFVLGDFIDNFILYDRFRNAAQSAYKTHIISRNVSAKIFQANANLGVNFWRNFGARLNLWYSWGENSTDKRALYQIRPFEVQLNLDYEDYVFFGKFNLGGAFRALAKQTRRDDSINLGLGIDRDRAGFALFDLYAAISIYDKIALRFGVDNVLNKTYSEYISASHVEAIAPTAIINAPGRTFYLSLHGSF